MEATGQSSLAVFSRPQADDTERTNVRDVVMAPVSRPFKPAEDLNARPLGA